MLVLTRKKQEQIQIGDNITITVIRMNAQQVRIGIEAPEHIRIMRAEIAQTDQGVRVSNDSDDEAAKDQKTVLRSCDRESSSESDSESEDRDAALEEEAPHESFDSDRDAEASMGRADMCFALQSRARLASRRLRRARAKLLQMN